MGHDACVTCNKLPVATGMILYASAAHAPLIWWVYTCQWFFIYNVLSFMPRTLLVTMSEIPRCPPVEFFYTALRKYALGFSMTCLGGAVATTYKPRKRNQVA